MSKMWGREEREYEKLASSHSKANIILWLIGGIIYNIYHSNFVSISSALLVLPGIFLISFASIPTFWMNLKKDQIVRNTNNYAVLALFTIWVLIDLIYPVFLSVGFILLVEQILS